MLGTARRPVKDNDLPLLVDKTANMDTRQLAAFALATQALRFEPPSLIDDLQGFEPLAQTWPFMSTQSRRALLSFLDKNSADSKLAEAAAMLIDYFQISPHPFDFLKLSNFAKSHAAMLGPNYQKLCGVEDGGKIDEIHSEDDWQTASPSAKVRYFSKLRWRDPKAGLEFLEKYFSSQPANIRYSLLGHMSAYLSEIDRPFLEGLSTDRSVHVRQEAEKLIKDLHMTTLLNDRNNQLIKSIAVEKKGFIKRRRTLALDSATAQKMKIANNGTPYGVIQDFRHISLNALIEALDFESVESLFEAAKDDEALIIGFAVSAFVHQEFTALKNSAHLLPADLWQHFLCFPSYNIAIESDDEIEFYIENLFHPEKMTSPLLPDHLSHLYTIIKKPLPVEKFEALDQSGLLDQYIKDTLELEEEERKVSFQRMMHAFAALTPPQSLSILKKYIDKCPYEYVDNVQYYTKFATAIAKDAAQ